MARDCVINMFSMLVAYETVPPLATTLSLPNAGNGNMCVNTRLHPTGVRWNIELTQKLPVTGNATSCIYSRRRIDRMHFVSLTEIMMGWWIYYIQFHCDQRQVYIYGFFRPTLDSSRPRKDGVWLNKRVSLLEKSVPLVQWEATVKRS